MDCCPLNITMLSADNIKDVNLFGKMDVYVVVSISGNRHTRKKTKVDTNCGTHPRWNQEMQLIIEERSLCDPNIFLLIQLKADKSIGDNKHLGEVSIPIPELFQNANKNNAEERVVEYQVKTNTGKRKGTLKFSYKFGEKCASDVIIKTKKKKAGKKHKRGSSMPPLTLETSSHLVQGTGYPRMESPTYQQPLPPGMEPPRMSTSSYQQQPPVFMAVPGFQQFPPGMVSVLPPGHYPIYPYPQGYGAYSQPGGYVPPGYRYSSPPGHGYQQPV